MPRLHNLLRYKAWQKFLGVWPALLFGVLASVELTYFTIYGKGYDFAVFHEACRLTLKLQSPWDAVFDPIHAAFLNGPITAALISPLGFLSVESALLITRGISLLATPVIVLNFINYFFPDQKVSLLSKRILIASSLVILTFPMRANLEYGQFFVLFLTLFVFALKLSLSPSARDLIISGILIGICCDYKPQCFALIGIFIGFSNLYILIGGALSLVVGGSISIFLTGKFPYSVWVDVILKRSEGLASGEQMHIYALFPLQIVIVVVLTILALFIIVLIRTNFELENPHLKILILFVLILLTPWMHPTDLMLVSVFVIAISIQKSSIDFTSSAALGCLFVWSNNFWINLLLGIITLVALLLYLENKRVLFSPKILIVTVPSLVFSLTSNLQPSLEQLQRIYWGVASVIFATVSVAMSVIKLRDKQPHQTEQVFQ